MKKPIRTALLVVHVVGVALGMLIAALGIRSVIENYPTDSLDVALSRTTTTSTITVIAVSYIVTLIRRGFTPEAPLLYALSFGVAGLVVEANGRMMAKDFAPSVATSSDYAISTTWIVAAWLAALCAIIWTYRRSRFPLF
ncbi:MAG: hypothetical protein JNK07_02065 [Alphaproteobacteria bacterium]|nr:hypothetical protein [Alphaproteobacteria bacterium]